MHHDVGDHASALRLFHQALEILGDAHAASLRSLGVQHMLIRRATLRADRPDSAASLNSLPMLHQNMGDDAASLPLFRQAREIRRTALGENHPDYAISLNNLAGLYQDMGDHAAALPLFHQALEIYRTTLGENHPAYAGSLDSLAVLHRDMGDHTTALPLCRQALEIYRTALGEKHPEYASSLNNLAMLYAAMGCASEAMPLMEQATAIEDQMIGQILAIGSERQRAAFLNTVLAKLYAFLSLVLQHLGDSPRAIQTAFELVLRRKAVAAEAVAAQRDAVLGGKYAALEPKLHELTSLRMQIARKTLAGPGPEGLDSHMRELADWEAQREGLEAELARQIPEMNLEKKLRDADRRAVALNLREGVALVEFVRFPVFDFKAVPARGEPRWKAARYVAFVLAGSEPDEVKMIDLGEAESIDRLIAGFRAGTIAEAETADARNMAIKREEAPPTAEDDAGSVLRATLFDRLVPALGSRRRLLIAPDGDLTRLPFEVLPTTDGRHLIDDYQISYLSCGRDVLRFGAAAGRPGRPLVVADPDFELETVTVHEPTMQPAPPLTTTARSTGRHSRDLDRDRNSYHFHRLPGTRNEGERVATLLGVSPWLDATALEGRLKNACRSPRILHLATHGFFLPDQQRDLNRAGRGAGFDFGELAGAVDGLGRLSGPMMENPMLRSGLALAGANTWLKAGNAPDEAEDGLLTAEDVTGLDLLATELVVLSACETGLGRVHVGEGVFGLRRAFVLAGAKTLVMSLWKVPDEPTGELMENFYGRLLAGECRAEALRGAQLAMKLKYPDPFYWGAFICQGDPSPLGTVRQIIADTGIANDCARGSGVTPDKR